MRVAIDYNAAVRQGAGIGRYTRELVGAIVAQAPQHRFVLCYAARGLPADSPYLPALRQLCAENPHVSACPIPLGERLLTILWQRLRLPLPLERFAGPFDLLHATDFVLPPARTRRSLLTVHDLTFLAHPETAVPELRRYLAAAVPRSLRRATHVLADSSSTRDDLARLLGADPARISVVYPGVGAQFRPIEDAAALDAARARLALPRRFLLHVGTLEPRKNLVRLLQAFARVAGGQPELSLVLAGRRGWLSDPIFAAISQLGLEPRVRLLDFVADQDLPLLYNLAETLAYPSLYEGFGLPAAEALACGTPVLASNSSSLPEVVGDAGLLVDPADLDALAAGLERLAGDPALRAELRARGPAQAARFSWQAAARQVIALYEGLGATG